MKILDFGCKDDRLKKLIEYYMKNCEWVLMDKHSQNKEVINFYYKSGMSFNYPNNYFDVIFAISSLQYVDDISLILKEFKRILKNKGYIIITYPTWLWDEHKTRSYAIKPLIKQNWFIEENTIIGGNYIGYYYIKAEKREEILK